MQARYTKHFIFSLIFSFAFIFSYSQTNSKDSANYITKRASSKYNTSNLHNFFWGKHYRKEWYTPVTFKKVILDTLKAGLTPYKTGGGRQSESIRVVDNKKQEYVFRSIDKSFSGALPDIVQGTFISHLADDQVTIAHPYASIVVAPLAEAAKIYHASPSLYYVPKQKALGAFNDSTGNELYSFEQRPDENWETEPNFGNSKNIVSTDKMLEKILDDNDNSVDQLMFAKCRLFDMYIGDCGRHEDQWRWASFKDGNKTLYRPIPRDRDNAFKKFDGLLLKILIPAANARHLQSFDYKIKDVDAFNFPARNLDHHLLNEVTKEQWIDIAKQLQNEMTDAIIDNAVKQMPKEVYSISGPEIAAKLKSRRKDLVKYATTYYNFLAKEVEITGTEKNDLFEVKRLSADETEVNIYKIPKKGDTKKTPYYHRIFKTNETHEIRLYGIAGNDEYDVSGKVKKGIKVRLIGGTDKDEYSDKSSVRGPSHKTKIYDNPGNTINTSKETVVNLSSDSAINEYNYKYFNYDKKGFTPLAFYNNNDHFYVGLAYSTTKYKWRKYPLANTQYIDVKYSLSQKAFSSTYASTYTDLLGKWNLHNYLNYDEVRWTNFYGLGNESILQTKQRDYFRMRDKEFNASVGVDRVFKNKHKIYAAILYQDYKILNDTARFIAKQFAPNSSSLYSTNNFDGIKAGYVYQSLNDSILPVKGISLGLNGNYTNDMRKTTGNVAKYHAEITWYAPLSKKFGLVIRGGGSTLTGSPYFYQYNILGGTENLRGYQRERFYGNSTAYTQNELRWITNFNSYIFNGKIGLFALYDAGRVWLKGENSNTWHSGYGAGIILSVFNKLSSSAAYAISPEDSNFHLSFLKKI
jgi:hypothetical protein